MYAIPERCKLFLAPLSACKQRFELRYIKHFVAFRLIELWLLFSLRRNTSRRQRCGVELCVHKSTINIVKSVGCHLQCTLMAQFPVKTVLASTHAIRSAPREAWPPATRLDPDPPPSSSYWQPQR